MNGWIRHKDDKKLCFRCTKDKKNIHTLHHLGYSLCSFVLGHMLCSFVLVLLIRKAIRPYVM